MRIEGLHQLHRDFPDIDGYWNFENLSQTEDRIRMMLPAEGQSWNLEQIEALTQLARVQGLQAKMPEAKTSLTQAQELLVNQDPKARVRAEVRLLMEQGRLFCLSRMPSKGMDYFAQAWTLATEHGLHFFAVESALMIAISQPVKAQAQWLQKAFEVVEQSKNELAELWLSHIYMMQGWHSFDVHRFDKALESFEKAAARPRHKGDDGKVFASRWCIARAIRALGRFDEAFEIQKQLLQELTDRGQENGHVFLEMAECLQAQQLHEEAKAYFVLAYKSLSADQWYADNREFELSRIQYISKKR